MDKLMNCIFAIHGLKKYIPPYIIQTYIVPFAIEKPCISCKKCGRILHINSKKNSSRQQPTVAREPNGSQPTVAREPNGSQPTGSSRTTLGATTWVIWDDTFCIQCFHKHFPGKKMIRTR